MTAAIPQNEIANLPGGPLAESDYPKLEARYIDRETAEKAGLRRVNDREGGEILGRERGNFSGVSIPYTWPAVNLGRVEHRISASEDQAGTANRLLASIVLAFIRIVGELPKHHCSSLLALAHLCAAVLPLLVRAPFARLVAFGLRSSPQAQCVDAPIRLLACYIDRRESKSAAGVPRHSPVAYALLDCVDDLGRHACVNVPFVGCGTVRSRHRETDPFALFRGSARLHPVAVPIRSSVRFHLIIEHQNHS
jgi:hypothetical protein